jgi:prepilin-type N-terminal cleavage/methylation domain-containing protein
MAPVAVKGRQLMWCSDQAPALSRARGFTLLELLTVLLLIGFLLGVGLRLDVGLSRNTPEQLTAQLAQQFTLASLEAVQAGSVWGLDFYQQGGQSGYRWLVYEGQRWRGADAALVDAETSTYSWPADSVAEWIVDAMAVVPAPLQSLADDTASATLQPEILLLPTRENTPFTLVLRQAAQTQNASLRVDALGRTTLETVDAAQ